MLFDEAVMFTDIHFGLRGNSIQHNEMCIEYIEWMIEQCKERGITKALFLGDYFHNRAVINVSTLNYGLKGMRLLNDYFDDVWFLVGNHDMYYRQKRDVTSVKFAENFQNVHLISEITEIEDCLFLPFLVGDEWKQLEQKSAKYVFGHLELPGYKLNSLVEMPDHGKESESTFSQCEYVFSGHFHKRQYKELTGGAQIHYIGNTFPHNFNDAWDDARGCVFLKWGDDPVYTNWEDCPKFRTANMSDVLEDPNFYLGKRVTAKVHLDCELTAEEISFIRETFKEFYEMSDFKTTGAKASAAALGTDDDIQVESVDQVVIDQINALDTNSLDKALLIELYNSV